MNVLHEFAIVAAMSWAVLGAARPQHGCVGTRSTLRSKLRLGLADPLGRIAGTRSRKGNMKHRAGSVRTQLAWWALIMGFSQSCWAAAAVPSANWDRFRGPNGQGIAESAQPPIEFARDKNMKWRVPAPEAYGSVVVWDDRVFLSGLEGDFLAIVRLSTEHRPGRVEADRRGECGRGRLSNRQRPPRLVDSRSRCTTPGRLLVSSRAPGF